MSFVTRDPVDVAELLRGVSDPELGGTALFLGSVRRGHDDGPVEAIEYSAYEEMLEAECSRIVSETVGRSPRCRVAMVHRIGVVPVGEPSIAVVAAAPHRGEAFAACRRAIEQAKKRLPVWKKEIFKDGSTAWRENERPESETNPKSA